MENCGNVTELWPCFNKSCVQIVTSTTLYCVCASTAGTCSCTLLHTQVCVVAVQLFLVGLLM
uniref:Uncharacterized protein n=1 Tax=Anguilla anguilla TaxID=7936 RepID=A0A0E9WYZ4_ANGAN